MTPNHLHPFTIILASSLPNWGDDLGVVALIPHSHTQNPIPSGATPPQLHSWGTRTASSAPVAQSDAQICSALLDSGNNIWVCLGIGKPFDPMDHHDYYINHFPIKQTKRVSPIFGAHISHCRSARVPKLLLQSLVRWLFTACGNTLPTCWYTWPWGSGWSSPPKQNSRKIDAN